ncbi:MAG: DUF5908 family protein [Bacteroidota bacterium]
MAVEIKELHVNLHLSEQEKDSEEAPGKTAQPAATSQSQLVEEVAAQVLNILKEQQER